MKTQIIFTKEPAMMKTKNSGEKNVYRDDESCEYFYFSLFLYFISKFLFFLLLVGCLRRERQSDDYILSVIYPHLLLHRLNSLNSLVFQFTSLPHHHVFFISFRRRW